MTVNGTSTINNAAGAAFVIGAGGRDIDASAVAITNDNTLAGSVVSITGQSGGAISFGSLTNSGTTATNVIVTATQTAGTVSFGNVGITNFGNASTDTAVSLGGAVAGSVSFTDLDITTTNGGGLNVGAITFAPGSTPTINATGGPALTLNGTTLSGGAATFNNVTSATSSGAGVSLTNVAGNLTLSAGSISGATGGAFTISGGSGNVTDNGTITENLAASAVQISGKTGGVVTFGGSITAGTTTANAVILTSNTGATINF